MDTTQIEKVKKEYAHFLYATKVRGNASLEEKQATYAKLLQLSGAFVPKTLFRYRPCNDYDYSSLAMDRAYFSRPSNFNDPHDCLMYVNPDRIDEYKNQLESAQLIERLQAAIKSGVNLNSSPNLANVMPAAQQSLDEATSTNMEGLISEIAQNGKRFADVKQTLLGLIDIQHFENQRSAREDVFIACFSEHLCSTTMWAHYANNHKGFALEYDTAELSLLSSDCYRSENEWHKRHVTNLHPVLYSNMRYDATEFEIETYNTRLAAWVKKSNGFTTPDILHDIKLNTSKGGDWKYEGEWRLIYTPSTTMPINYAAYEVIRPIAIYFGSQMPESQREKLKQLIIRENGSAIKMYEMIVDTAQPEYKISPKEVTS